MTQALHQHKGLTQELEEDINREQEAAQAVSAQTVLLMGQTVDQEHQILLADLQWHTLVAEEVQLTGPMEEIRVLATVVLAVEADQGMAKAKARLMVYQELLTQEVAAEVQLMQMVVMELEVLADQV
jgi:hypothetical protein